MKLEYWKINEPNEFDEIFLLIEARLKSIGQTLSAPKTVLKESKTFLRKKDRLEIHSIDIEGFLKFENLVHEVQNGNSYICADSGEPTLNFNANIYDDVFWDLLKTKYEEFCIKANVSIINTIFRLHFTDKDGFAEKEIRLTIKGEQ